MVRHVAGVDVVVITVRVMVVLPLFVVEVVVPVPTAQAMVAMRLDAVLVVDGDVLDQLSKMII